MYTHTQIFISYTLHVHAHCTWKEDEATRESNWTQRAAICIANSWGLGRFSHNGWFNWTQTKENTRQTIGATGVTWHKYLGKCTQTHYGELGLTLEVCVVKVWRTERLWCQRMHLFHRTHLGLRYICSVFRISKVVLRSRDGSQVGEYKRVVSQQLLFILKQLL